MTFFVNTIARGDGTTRIRPLFHAPATLFFSILSNLHFWCFKLWNKLIFHVFHSFLTFYECWTTPIACIHIFCILGNIYIEAFKVLLVAFIVPLFFLAHFRLLHQFELIWMVEFEFLLNPNHNSNYMGN